MKTVDWYWPAADPSGGADGSAMGKLFRGGQLTDTALLAREAIQNSADAHERFRESHPEIPLKVVFRFVHLYDDDKAAAVEALGLQSMVTRRENYGLEDPLQPGSILDSLEDGRVPLELLFVEDYGTHGLFGKPSLGKKSHLFKAMYYIGASSKGADQGGSYGFGKSALQRASRTKSLVAYSMFEAHDDDPVRERLIGFTWWQDHQSGATLYSGRGIFGDQRSAGPNQRHVPMPFEDQYAHEVASALGFKPRNPDLLEDTGTSFLIPDPSVDPADLLYEIEKWWWPALEEHKLDVEVVLPSGEIRKPKQSSNPFVAQFLPAFRIATGLDEPRDPNRERLASKSWRDRGSGGSGLGQLGLTIADVDPDTDADDADRSSLVALMRGPRMVVKYEQYGSRRIPLRGAFVASDDANPLLRETEPSTHDRWTDNDSADVPKQATDAAKAVLSRIRHSVSTMSKEITPPPPRANRSLSHFAKLMKGFVGNKPGARQGSGPEVEPIEIHFVKGRPEPIPAEGDEVRVKSRFAVRLAEHAPGESCQVRIGCRLYIYEDETRSQSEWPVSVRVVGERGDFTQESDGSWSGTLASHTKATFEAESKPYPDTWTTSLQPRVIRVSEWGPND